MTDEVNGVSGKVGLDNSDFKTATAEINRELRLVESSFRASAAALTDWTQDATGLENRIKTLNTSIDLQGRKVEATRAEYERMVQVYGENSKQAQDMEIRLNKETEKLNSMTTELGQTQGALKELGQSSKDAGKGLDALGAASAVAKAALNSVKGVAVGLKVELHAVAALIQGELAVALGVLKLGAGSVLALGAAALVTGGLIAGLTFKAAAASDQLGELADKTGIPVERLQELGFIGKQVGTDLETVTSANARLIRSMSGAGKATSTSGKAFAALGVSVKDSHGQLRDANVVFGEALDALSKIQNPTERDALAMEIFGKNAQELNPLIKLGSRGMEEMADRAHRLGAVVSAETIGALGNLNDQLDGFKDGLSGLGTTILAAFAPLLSGVLGQATGLLEQMVGIVRGSGGDFGKMAQGLAQLFQGVVAGVARQLPSLIQSGLGVVKVIVQAILDSLPTLINAGVGIIQTLASFIVDNLPMLGEAATSLLSAFSDALIKVLPVLINVGLQIIQTLIGAIVKVLPGLLPQLADVALKVVGQLLTAIQELLPELIPVAAQIIDTLISFIEQNIPQLITVALPLITQLIQAILPLLPHLILAAIEIIEALAGGLTDALPILIPVIVTAITQIVELLTAHAPELILVALVLLTALEKGLIAAMPTLIRAIPVIIRELVDGLAANKQPLAKVAGELLGALATGIIGALPLLFTAMVRVVTFMVQTLFSQKLSLISIGGDLIAGLWQGIKDGWAQLISDFEGLVALLPQAVKDALGIHSPSSVGIAITKNFVGSMGLGALAAIGDVVRTFASVGQQLAFATAGGLSSAGNTFQTVNRDTLTLNNRGGVIQFVDGAPRSVGKQVRDKARRF